MEHLGRFLLLFPLLARIGNLQRRGQAAQNSRFSGIVSSRALWALLPARIGDSWIGTRAYTRVFPVRRGLSCESRFRGGVNGCGCSNYQLFKCSFWVRCYKVVRELKLLLLTIYRGRRIIRQNFSSVQIHSKRQIPAIKHNIFQK